MHLFRTATALVIVCAANFAAQGAAAGTTQVALFTGFLAGANTGMDILRDELALAGIHEYSGMVFGWSEQQEAFDWIQQQTDRSTLVLIGHSFGGNSTLQLADGFLKPIGIDVDLTIQVDPVANFFSGPNDVLPANVEVGFNYYQISTGIFEPQGEDNVQGATNINTEVLFNDTSITHNSIDNDPRLHALISQRILDNLNIEDADFDGNNLVDGTDYLTWQRNFGTVGTAMRSTGDANSDLDVEYDDLRIWEQQFGSSSAPAIFMVPEPTSLRIALVLLLVLLYFHGAKAKLNRSRLFG